MADTATTDCESVDQLFTDLVRVETRLYNAVAERVKAEAGLAAGHFELLRHVRDHPDTRVADLAFTFAIGVGATSKIVDRLEGQGWLQRHPNPTNRRSSLLTLTTAGQDAVSRAEPVWRSALRQLLIDAFAPTDLVEVAHVLGRLRVELERRGAGRPAG